MPSLIAAVLMVLIASVSTGASLSYAVLAMHATDGTAITAAGPPLFVSLGVAWMWSAFVLVVIVYFIDKAAASVRHLARKTG